MQCPSPPRRPRAPRARARIPPPRIPPPRIPPPRIPPPRIPPPRIPRPRGAPPRRHKIHEQLQFPVQRRQDVHPHHLLQDKRGPILHELGLRVLAPPPTPTDARCSHCASAISSLVRSPHERRVALRRRPPLPIAASRHKVSAQMDWGAQTGLPIDERTEIVGRRGRRRRGSGRRGEGASTTTTLAAGRWSGALPPSPTMTAGGGAASALFLGHLRRQRRRSEGTSDGGVLGGSWCSKSDI